MLTREKRLNILGITMLFLTTIAWGSAFTILKNTISELPSNYVIGIRFFVSGLIISLVLIKRIIKVNKKTVLRGIILGIILSLGYIIQTLGLKYTTPSRNAFITATYCVMCPFLFWILRKVKPKSYNIISAIVCVVGIGLISLSKSENIEGNPIIGDAITLVSAILFGLQIVYIDAFQTDEHASMILPIELLSAGIILFLISLITEVPFRKISDFAITGDNIFNICYLTLVCTLLAQAGQFFGQKYCSNPSLSSLILSLEAVFGAIFAVILGAEKLNVSIVIGFVFVFIAMLITIFKVDIFKFFKKNKKETKYE